MRWTYDDGGRKAAGFSGIANDCVTRSIAIATGRSYRDVYETVNTFGQQERRSKTRTSKSSARSGVYSATTRRVLASYGWQWMPIMKVGIGCTMHLRDGELPEYPRMIVRLSVHVTTVVHGTIRDTHDPTREGDRCVYGFWIPY